MCLKYRVKVDHIARLIAASMIAAFAATGAGCAGDEGFPQEVPVHGHHQSWVDRPLERSLYQEQSKTRALLTDFLEQRREVACRPDAVEARRRADLQTRAFRRVEHAHSRASVQAEQTAMRQQSAQSDEIDLSPIVAFEDSKATAKPADATLLTWTCAPPVEDACLESAAHGTLDWLYAREFRDTRVSRVETLRVLPVLREDLEWALSYVGDAPSPQQAAVQIAQMCRQGDSPLGEYVRAHADASDDRGGSIARRLGAKSACKSIATIYVVLFRRLDNHLKAAESGRTCPPASELEWNL
jgi:hypothetical protein